MFRSLRRPSARLCAWNARSGQVHWSTRIRRHPTSSRFLIVAATTLLVAVMTYSASLPLPFRTGEIPSRGMRVLVPFVVVSEPQSEWVGEDCDKPTPTIDHFPTGVLIAKPGEPINERQLTCLPADDQQFLFC